MLVRMSYQSQIVWVVSKNESNCLLENDDDIYINLCLFFLCLFYFIFLPQNTSNTKKQGDHTKANKSGEEAQKETMGLIDIGLPPQSIK